MKIRFMVLVLALFVAVTAFAQPQRMTPQERVDKMAKELGLTDEQKAKVLDVFTQQQKDMPKPPAEGTFDREAMREQRMKMRQEQNAKLKAILTEEQYAKFEKMMPAGRGPGGPPPKGESGKEKAGSMRSSNQ